MSLSLSTFIDEAAHEVGGASLDHIAAECCPPYRKTLYGRFDASEPDDDLDPEEIDCIVCLDIADNACPPCPNCGRRDG